MGRRLLRRIFRFCARPAAMRLCLLRWVISKRGLIAWSRCFKVKGRFPPSGSTGVGFEILLVRTRPDYRRRLSANSLASLFEAVEKTTVPRRVLPSPARKTRDLSRLRERCLWRTDSLRVTPTTSRFLALVRDDRTRAFQHRFVYLSLLDPLR